MLLTCNFTSIVVTLRHYHTYPKKSQHTEKQTDSGDFALKTTTKWNLLILISVLSLVGNFTSTLSAQDYYPANVGNEWVLEKTDGEHRRIYTLETPTAAADQHLILLKIATEEINTGKVTGSDEYFVTTDNAGIKIHKTALQTTFNRTKIDVLATFPTPVIFFPKQLESGNMWEIEGDTEIDLGGLKISGKSTTTLKIVDFEPVHTTVATFNACAKIEFTVAFTSQFLTIDPTPSYQWLAPNIGPVKYETADGDIFEIVSFKRSLYPTAQNLPMWNLPANTFQATGSRLGGILNAKILTNVEDYVTEVANVGIISVSGEILPPGNGTGFAKNAQGKHDLWIAGRFANAPITGSIALFAENSKGRISKIITVTLNIN